MSLLEIFFIFSIIIQFAHAVEELLTGFHKKWYLFKMPFWIFFLFEILFSLFWILVLLIDLFPNRETLQTFFLVLMLANGIQHIIWWRIVKKYVPGLITAPLHIVVSLIYFLLTFR